jgi:hypothetical protein
MHLSYHVLGHANLSTLLSGAWFLQLRVTYLHANENLCLVDTSYVKANKIYHIAISTKNH